MNSQPPVGSLGPHVYRHEDGRLYGFGWNKQPDDKRDHHLSRYLAYKPALPTKVDLRPDQTPVYDQGTEGCCGGFSTRSMIEYEAKRGGYLPPGGFSPAFIYYEARALEGVDLTTNVPFVNEDSGINLRDACRVLLHQGVSPYADDVYVVGGYATPPSQQAINDAQSYKILAYASLTSLLDMKNCLASLGDFIIGITVYKGIFNAPNGVVPVPAAGEKSAGGHALCVVGYDDSKGWLIFKNSWSASWGDAGYGYLPYAYVSMLIAQAHLEAWRVNPRGKLPSGP